VDTELSPADKKQSKTSEMDRTVLVLESQYGGACDGGERSEDIEAMAYPIARAPTAPTIGKSRSFRLVVVAERVVVNW
jgi:hypothetical protein